VTLPDPKLVDALTDVRKAYRLLWCYQRRVFDVVRLIADEFDDMAFYYWQTRHSGRPCNSGTNPMARWTWDMLPMVEASYLFLPGGVDRNLTLPGQWMLEVNVASDSGFKKPDDNSEPDPADFEDPATSTSNVTLYAWYCTGQSKLNWFSGVWNYTEWPTEEEGWFREHAEPPFKIFGRSIDLADLPDKASVKFAAGAFRNDASARFGTELT
jgi:hypothetical protein